MVSDRRDDEVLLWLNNTSKIPICKHLIELGVKTGYPGCSKWCSSEKRSSLIWSKMNYFCFSKK